MRTLCATGIAAMLAAALVGSGRGAGTAMTLRSPAVTGGDRLPTQYTCDGAGASPPLAWRDVPGNAKSLALLVVDPDAPDPAAPQRIWTHWVLYDLPPASSGLAEGVAVAALPPGTRQGHNDWGRSGYGAACPPIGSHRYIFTVYALDTVLADLHMPDRIALERAMDGHIVARAQLVARYAKRAGG